MFFDFQFVNVIIFFPLFLFYICTLKLLCFVILKNLRERSELNAYVQVSFLAEREEIP